MEWSTRWSKPCSDVWVVGSGARTEGHDCVPNWQQVVLPPGSITCHWRPVTQHPPRPLCCQLWLTAKYWPPANTASCVGVVPAGPDCGGHQGAMAGARCWSLHACLRHARNARARHARNACRCGARQPPYEPGYEQVAAARAALRGPCWSLRRQALVQASGELHKVQGAPKEGWCGAARVAPPLAMGREGRVTRVWSGRW